MINKKLMEIKNHDDMAENISRKFSCWPTSETNSKTQSYSRLRSIPETHDIIQGDVEDLLMVPKMMFPKFTHLNLGLPSGPSHTVTSDNRTDSWNDINTIRNLSRHKKGFEVPIKIQVNPIISQLKERFVGKRGNPLISELLSIAEKNSSSNIDKEISTIILAKEFEHLLKFSERRNMKQKAYAQFDLFESIAESYSNDTYKTYIDYVADNHKAIPQYGFNLKQRAIRLYLRKKKVRNSTVAIKYEERRNLALTRKRYKGRFLKQR